MIRRAFLRRLVFAAAGLAAGMARADPVDEITAEIRAQGFTIAGVQRTWLGRVRIIGQNEHYRREVVIDPTTGEIRRDLLIPRKPGAGSSTPQTPAQPELGNSRGIGSIEEEPPGTDGSDGETEGEDDDANWGGGWGSQDTPPEDPGGDDEGGADAR